MKVDRAQLSMADKSSEQILDADCSLNWKIASPLEHLNLVTPFAPIGARQRGRKSLHSYHYPEMLPCG